MNGSDDDTQETYGLKSLNSHQNQRNGTVWKRFMESCKQIKVSTNKKQFQDTFKQIYKSDLAIKRSFIIFQ